MSRFIKICPVVPCGQTDRQTNMTKLIVAFRNFANAPNKVATETVQSDSYYCYEYRIVLYPFFITEHSKITTREGETPRLMDPLHKDNFRHRGDPEEGG